MKKIKVFDREIADGISGLVESQACLSYTLDLESWDVSSELLEKAIANRGDKYDPEELYTTKSVFVSSVWNLNDDVFSPAEMWEARHTPLNKPTNVDHDQDQLVGHITSVWAIDDDGNLIDENIAISSLPNVFHICNGAVIYKTWSKPHLQKRVDTLISEIETGTKCVSMECWFDNFDYAMKKGDDYHVVARDGESSFLTKHLRAYGGSGEYEGYKIGRVIKNITFSGKGYVDKPANPDSVIFSKGESFEFASATSQNPLSENSGVYTDDNKNNSNEELTMAETLEQKEATELKDARAEIKELQKQLADANVAEFKSQIDKLEATIAEKEVEKADLADKLAEAIKVEDELKQSEEKLAEAEKSVASLTEKLETIEVEAIRANRISILVDGDFDKTEAEAKVDLFENLNDEQFSVIAEELIKANQKIDEQPAEEATATVENEDEEEVAPPVEVEETVSNEVPPVENLDEENEAVAGLRTFVAANMGARLGLNLDNEDSEN